LRRAASERTSEYVTDEKNENLRPRAYDCRWPNFFLRYRFICSAYFVFQNRLGSSRPKPQRRRIESTPLCTEFRAREYRVCGNWTDARRLFLLFTPKTHTGHNDIRHVRREHTPRGSCFEIFSGRTKKTMGYPPNRRHAPCTHIIQKETPPPPVFSFSNVSNRSISAAVLLIIWYRIDGESGRCRFPSVCTHARSRSVLPRSRSETCMVTTHFYRVQKTGPPLSRLENGYLPKTAVRTTRRGQFRGGEARECPRPTAPRTTTALFLHENKTKIDRGGGSLFLVWTPPSFRITLSARIYTPKGGSRRNTREYRRAGTLETRTRGLMHIIFHVMHHMIRAPSR